MREQQRLAQSEPNAGAAVRIAMWSGPRNISTALMRSWEARADTFVCDEPLYAHYLAMTRLPHPGAEEIIAHHEVDWRRVVAWLTSPPPSGESIFYQKHMAHHLLPEIDRAWTRRLTNCLLIRDPEEMLTSLVKVTPEPRVEDTGLPQQLELQRELVTAGAPPVVLDARDVLVNPRGMLEALCARIDVPFDEAMLSWAPGPRDTDGVWAKHWYGAVERSTGFAPYRPKNERVPPALESVLAECQALYDALAAHRLTIGQS